MSILTQSNGTWSVAAEVDLPPNTTGTLNSRGLFGGEYPSWGSIAKSGGNYTAYVSSIRDREIDAVNITTPASASVSARIALKGQPLKSTLDAAQANLYVAEDQTDSVVVISTSSNALLAEQQVVGPTGDCCWRATAKVSTSMMHLRYVYPASITNLSGNNTNSVFPSPDGNTLYVTNGTTNDVAVVGVSALLQNNANPVLGLMPTGQYPVQAIVTGGTGPGQFMYVINAKSPSGPNVNHCHGTDSFGQLGGKTSAACNASNQYTLQMTKAGLQFLLVPAPASLPALTNQVALNNNFANTTTSNAGDPVMTFLAQNIKHVIYIIKENRTYDQVLGDLGKGNGDPALVEWGSTITPNQHAIANNFVDLDNFYDTSEVSYDGWSWSTTGMGPDIVIRQVAVNYCFRGGVAYESEGDLRGINLNYRSGTLAANMLPGTVDTDAPDGPNVAINGGYLWNNALKTD